MKIKFGLDTRCENSYYVGAVGVQHGWMFQHLQNFLDLAGSLLLIHKTLFCDKAHNKSFVKGHLVICGVSNDFWDNW